MEWHWVSFTKLGCTPLSWNDSELINKKMDPFKEKWHMCCLHYDGLCGSFLEPHETCKIIRYMDSWILLIHHLHWTCHILLKIWEKDHLVLLFCCQPSAWHGWQKCHLSKGEPFFPWKDFSAELPCHWSIFFAPIRMISFCKLIAMGPESFFGILGILIPSTTLESCIGSNYSVSILEFAL